jgi:hypothetical protein
MKYQAPTDFDGTGFFLGGSWVALDADRTVTVQPGDHTPLYALGFAPVPTQTPDPTPSASPATDFPDAVPTV